MGCLWTATGSRRFRLPKWWQSWWTRRPCSWGSQPPSGGQYGSGTRGHAFGRPEHGDAPRVQKGWKGITKKNWKSVKQSQHLQSPMCALSQFVAVSPKKACRDSLLLRRALKYKSEFVMCGYDSKWLEQMKPQIIAHLLLTLYKYGFPELPLEDIFPFPPHLKCCWWPQDVVQTKKRLAGCGHLKFSEWTWYLFGACSLLWRLQLHFKIGKSTNHGCNVEL